MRMMKPLMILTLLTTPIFSPANEMNVESYINFLIENDVEIERLIQQKAQTRFSKDLRLPTRSWILSVSSTHGLPLQDSQGRTSELNVEMSKNFRRTGTNLLLRYNQNDLADRNEQIQALQVQQSLIQNSFGLQTRLLEDSIDSDNLVTNLSLIEAYEDYVAEKIGAFLDLIAAQKNLETSQELYKDFKEIFSEVKKRRSKSIAISVDVYRAEAELLQFERAVLEAQARIAEVKRRLFSGVDQKVQNLKKTKITNQIPYLDEKEIAADFNDEDLNQSRTGQIIKASANSAAKNQKAVKRNLLPELGLNLGLSEDESNRFSTTVNRTEASIGLNLNYEFDNSLAKAQYGEAVLNQKLVEKSNQSLKNNLAAQLKSLKERIELQKKRVKILEKQKSTGKKLIDEEKKRFKRGLLNLRDFITVQTAYTQRQYDLIEEKVNLSRLIVQWKQLTDKLISKL
jgi:outer membrane protein TolC